LKGEVKKKYRRPFNSGDSRILRFEKKMIEVIIMSKAPTTRAEPVTRGGGEVAVGRERLVREES